MEGTRTSDMTDRTTGRSDVRTERQQGRTERQQNRQDYAKGAREDWQDYHGDWDDWNHWGPWGYAASGAAVVAGAYAAGTIISAASYSALPCTPTTVVVNGMSYSQCGSTWYQPAYSGGNVNYVVVNPPMGY